MRIFCVLCLFFCLVSLMAGEAKAGVKGVEFFAGYTSGHLKGQHRYQGIPLLADIDFDINPLAKKIGLRHQGLLQFQVEPFLSTLYGPKSDFEGGASFMLKIGLLPSSHKIQPYVKGGVGLDYMTLHTREQGTQFNFIESGALGVHYFFTRNTAFTVEGRLRHLSNCDIKRPNTGINTYFALMGLSYLF